VTTGAQSDFHVEEKGVKQEEEQVNEHKGVNEDNEKVTGEEENVKDEE
jgi:hypothetical protein